MTQVTKQIKKENHLGEKINGQLSANEKVMPLEGMRGTKYSNSHPTGQC